MKRIALMALATGSALIAAAPALATPIVAGAPALPPTTFAIGTQGTLLTSSVQTSQAFTFSTSVLSAVYRNTSGTLDFYYQITQTGAGSNGRNDPIQAFTVANYDGYMVDASTYAGATGSFVASNNTGEAAGINRNANGVITTDFTFGGVSPAASALATAETSLIYIFRTNATNFTTGTVGVSDGSATSVLAFQPTSAVPEAATWGMMILGFGAMGSVMRRRKTSVSFA